MLNIQSLFIMLVLLVQYLEGIITKIHFEQKSNELYLFGEQLIIKQVYATNKNGP